MRAAKVALAAVLVLGVAGCGPIGRVDPYAATCSDMGDTSGLDSVARSMVEEIDPERDPDQGTGEVASLLSQECEGKPLSYKPARAVKDDARRQLGR